MSLRLFVFVAVCFAAGVVQYLNDRKPSAFRIHNFSAGPARVDDKVLQKIQDEFMNFNGTGMSFMEISHRDGGGPVQRLMDKTAAMLRNLLAIPDNYHVLFMHGGAHGQFSAIPMNLGKRGEHLNYVVTGFWSQRSAKEGENHGHVVEINGLSEDGKSLKSPAHWKLDKAHSAYVHMCSSETIHGFEYLDDSVFPDDVLLVADFTSTLLSRPVNISKYGVIYASSGKNLGPSGLTVVIVRKDLVTPSLAQKYTPSILNYNLVASSLPISSIYNTPATFQIYVLSNILQDLIEKGGLAAMEARAKSRAAKVYSIIDGSGGFYVNTVSPESRSRMSIPFRIGDGDESLEKLFVAEGEKKQMLQLMRHPLFGGLRVTLYNGIPDASVEVLAQFMLDFAQKHAAS